MTHTWQPILTGALATSALAAAREVADALADLEPTHPGEAIDFALFWAYAAHAFESPAFDEAQERAMESLAVVLESAALGPHLFGGYAGAAWVLNHVNPAEAGEDDVVDMLDAAIAEILEGQEWPGQYDLISGLAGMGLHFVDRLPRPSAATALKMIVRHLDGLAEVRGDAIAWHTRVELLPEWQREHYPQGHYNLGLAHGIPAVLALLALIIDAGLADEIPRARELLVGGAKTVLDVERPDESGGAYSSALADLDEAGVGTRAAWCYGDPGVALALWRTGRALGDKALLARANKLATRIAQREASDCGVVDAGLCHGSAGLAHILNRLHQAGADELVRARAIEWFEETLANRRYEPVAGFPAYRPMEKHWEGTPSILEGAAGVALALIAAATESEPGWDRLLLADII